LGCAYSAKFLADLVRGRCPRLMLDPAFQADTPRVRGMFAV
jgi:hypothetical protein